MSNNKSKISSYLPTILLIFSIFFVIVIFLNMQEARNSDQPIENSSISRGVNKIKGYFNNVSENIKKWDKGPESYINLEYKNEGFMMTIHTGDTVSEVIIDSGSSSIVISGEECKKCPGTDKYPAIDSGKNRDIIRYGSQNNHVSWVKDDLKIGNIIFKNMNLAVTNKIVAKDLDPDDGEVEDVFNIFGISPVYGYHSYSRGFWEEQGIYKNHCWAIMARKNGGRLYLGNWPSKLNNLKEDDMFNIESMNSLCGLIGSCPFPVRYPMLRGDVTINTFTDKIIIKEAFIILDTGFTDCAVHPDLIDKIKGDWTITTNFGKGHDRNPKVYEFTDKEKNMDPLNLHRRVIILGNRWMMGHIIGVDWKNNRIAIADI